MTDEEEGEVRIIPLGEAIEDGAVLFAGGPRDARIYLGGLSAAERAEVAVWTRGHIFTPAQFEAELPGHEHHPVLREA